jgi:capsular exopolysaccharide synthesis family protein
LAAVLPKQYTAHADIYLTVKLGNSPADLASGANYAQTQVDSFSRVATTPLVLDRVIEEVGLEGYTASRLAGEVSVSVPTNTSIMVVSVERGDQDSAAEIANVTANSLVQAVATLAPTASEGEQLVRATIIADAVPPTAHSYPSSRIFLAVGLMAGLLAAAGQALLRFFLDKRIRTEAQVEALTNAPIMGRIGLDAQLNGADKPSGVSRVTSEDYRRLRTNMQFVGSREEDRGKTIVVTSSVPGEGKTTIAVNLATVLAEAGSSVLLIDGDLRRPRVARYMGLETTVGLTTILVGWASPADVLQKTRIPNLTVMPSGVIPPNPSELLASRAMKQLLDSAATHFDYTVVDCVPLLPVTDAAIVSRQTDGALVVADMQQITVPQLRFALGEIDSANGTVLGLVLNKMRAGSKDSSTYYGYQEYSETASPRSSAGAAHGASRPRGRG